MLFKERKNPVIQRVRCNQRILTIVQFGRSYFAIGINKSLLIDASNAFNGANIVSILGAKISGVVGFYFAMGLLFLFSPFKCYNLIFGQYQAFLGRFGL